MKTDFVINACIEDDDLYCILNTIMKLKERDDRVVVCLDKGLTNERMPKIVNYFNAELAWFDLHNSNFQERFEFHKTLFKNDLVFAWDADEIVPYLLLKVFREPFQNDPELDMLLVPRINLFPDATPENVSIMYVGDRRQNEILESQARHPLGWVNWPDYQLRVHRPMPYLKWGPATHSSIIGYKKAAQLPADPAIALVHIKTVEHQDRILRFYDKLGY